MIWSLIAFDIAYYARRYGLYLTAFIAVALSLLFALSFIDNAKTGELFLNSPITISAIASFSTLFIALFAAHISSDLLTRDVRMRISPITFTSGIAKSTYVFSRTSSILILTGILALFSLSLVYAVFHVAASQSPQLLITYDVAAIFHGLGYFLLPNVILLTLLMTGITLWTRSAMGAFAAVVVIFILTIFSMDALAGIMSKWDLAQMLDPTGFTVLKILRKQWTPGQLKYELVPFSGWVAINRIVWLLFASAIFATGYFSFSFTHRQQSTRRNKVDEQTNDAVVTTKHIALTRNFNLKTSAAQVFAETFLQIRHTIIGWPLLITVAFWAIFAHIADELLEGSLGVPLSAEAATVTALFRLPLLKLVMFGLLSIVASALVWRERDQRVDDLYHTLPASNRVFVISKLLCLFAFVVLIQTASMVSALSVPFLRGASLGDWPLYVRFFYGLSIIDYLIFATVVFSLHLVMNSRITSITLSFLLCAYMFFPDTIGIEHNLLVFGADPGLLFSAFTGYDESIFGWLAFKLHWVIFDITVTIYAVGLFIRGREDSLKSRCTNFKTYSKGNIWLAGALILFAVSNIFIFVNTNLRNDYENRQTKLERAAHYEMEYARFANVPQPLLRSIDLKVDLHHADESLAISGTYSLTNNTDEQISTLYVTKPEETSLDVINLSRAGKWLGNIDDDAFLQYQLETPLAPGATVQMTFAVSKQYRGFTNDHHLQMVSPDVAYVSSTEVLPLMGYRPDRELTHEKDRLAMGLKEKERFASLDSGARTARVGRELVHLKMTVSTDAGMTAVAPGLMVDQSNNGNRSFFTYDTKTLIANTFTIASAPYVRYEKVVDGKRLEIFSHPDHQHNVQTMMSSMEASLKQYQQMFGAYEQDVLKLVEYPGNGSLTSLAGMIVYPENFALLLPEQDGRNFDLPFAVIAHEVAHQWWGNQFVPAHVEGAPLLTESFAWYSAMNVVEDKFGKEHFDRLVSVMQDAYLTPRSKAGKPLTKSADHFLAYRKGPFAMRTLNEYLGRKNVEQVLTTFYQNYSGRDTRPATSLQFVHALKTSTPDSLVSLVHDLFEANTFWSFQIKGARKEKSRDGDTIVIVSVNGAKEIVDEEGNTDERGFSDWVQVGVFDADDNLLYAKMHRLKDGDQSIELSVKGDIHRVVIDPYRFLPEVDVADNEFVLVKR